MPLLLARRQQLVALAIGCTPNPRRAGWRAASEVGKSAPAVAYEQDVAAPTTQPVLDDAAFIKNEDAIG